MTKAKTPTKAVTPAKSNVYRALSEVFVVNSTTFAKEAPASQTKTLALAEGKPVRFVESFLSLTNPTLLRDKLLKGADISLELEFNGLSFSDDELKAIANLRPILAKIAAVGPDYPWLPEEDYSKSYSFNNSATITRNGHTIDVIVAKKLWSRASKCWSGGRYPGEVYECVHNNDYRYTNIVKAGVNIGCQSIPRAEVEWLARHLGWAPTIHRPK